MTLFEVVGIVSAFFFLLWVMRAGMHRATTPKAPERPPENAILVDGSNVLHWGKEPSVLVLTRVLRSLEKKGYAPIVFFDANVGYVIDDHYYNETKLAGLIDTPARHICVVSKGVVADQSILAFASDFGLRVVSNDRFRDWRVQFPHAAKKGSLIGGNWREGNVVWRGQL
ncbi:MAG: NYN domain-containing protein [Yoonia sp.]